MTKAQEHGIDCPCIECQKIRDLLFQGEITGKIALVGSKKDLERLRR